MQPPSLRGFLTATRGWIAVFCMVVLVLALVVYRQYAAGHRADVHARLHTIAELKASEIAGWRRERVADGQFFTGNLTVITLAQRILRGGGASGDPEATRMLLDLLGRMQRNHQYDRIALHDAEGRERVSSPSDGVPDDGHMTAMVRASIAAGDPSLLALHANNGETPHMIIVAPLQSGLGAVLIRVNPSAALAELVQTWPVPAQTAETLIVRRDGDEVMYLNTILGPTESDAMPPLPMTRTDLADVQATLGMRATIDTRDRHGVPVVASMLPIDGSNWHLVVSQTQDEVYGPLSDLALMLALVAMSLVVAGVATFAVVWGVQNRRLEAATHAHLTELRSMAQVVEASPVVLFQWRAIEGWPVEWVSSNVGRWGYTPEALKSGAPTFSEILYPDDVDRVHQEVERFTREGREAFVQEYRIRTADGRVLWMDDRTTVVRDADGRVIRYEGTLADITDRKQLQAQFVQAQKMETVGRLAGGVAHDFNNLLTVINGYAEFALTDLPAKDPLREMIQEIYDAGQRASGLTRQLLAFSRRQVMQPMSLDLNVVAEQMHKMLQRLIGEDVRLTFDLDPGLWRIRADAGQLEQVIMNLAVNARDAMPEGGTLVVTTRNLDEASGQIMMAVADTGCGMDEATQQRLFEPFFTTKRPGQGTGLGLATVYGIVTQAGGRIEVSSAVGRGTTFRVYLPRIQDDSGGDVVTARPEGIIRGTERVLIVEDEEALRRIAQRILTAAGYTTICAASGDEAIAILGAQDGSVDLLVTDVVMPGMSGHELAARLTVSHPHLKVLFASGYLPDAFPDRERLGPDVQFLAKPYSPSSLTAKVRDVLDRT
jgi:PAS domain S-box-containing protein